MASTGTGAVAARERRTARTSAARSAQAQAAPFEFFDVRVASAHRLGPSMIRITFTGPDLVRFRSGGRDQRIKLFLPQDGEERPLVPSEAGADWFTVWRGLDPERRAVMRSYTVREQRCEAGELDVDFALHGASGGPASHWAEHARPGDAAVLLGPVEPDNGGVDFRPPAGAAWVLVAGDETALPAIAGILGSLEAGTTARVWIKVPHADDIQELSTAADAEITWLVRGAGAGPELLLDTVCGAALPPGEGYAWVAGEAAEVRGLRRHLVRERGMDRRAVTFTGYWRRGLSEEQVLAEALATQGAVTAAGAAAE